MIRKTISVRHPKLDQYAHKLSSQDLYRLRTQIIDRATLAVFYVNGSTVKLDNVYGWCERCLDAPGVHDGERVGREGERLCDSCFDELYQDNGLPSIRVTLAEVEPAGEMVAA